MHIFQDMILMERKSPQICLVVLFFHEAFFSPLSNIRTIIAELFPEFPSIIVTIPGLTSRLAPDENDAVIVHPFSSHPMIRILNYLVMNLKISWYVLKESRNSDAFLFFMEAGLPLPMVIAKIRRKRIIWLLPSSLRPRGAHDHDLINLFLIPPQALSYQLTDTIVLYSPNLIQEWNLERYSEKIHIARHHFIQAGSFSDLIPYSRRKLLIGYFGRLSEEKGVLNFVRSLPAVLGNLNEIEVIIGGDGPLRAEIENFLQNHNLTGRVRMPGWIPSRNLPACLRNLRLLVLPSYTEGLPNIILEAMASGTPVLATPVGAVPDIITDGETGFIMENNSADCISRNIIRALENPELEEIAMNAKNMADTKFSFNGTVAGWRSLFQDDLLR
jgi:glycosyltransferase involved in cell wall biosynthesis